MKNLKYIVDTLFKKDTTWDVDWCTREEFDEYCQYLWKLNKEFFQLKMTYELFFDTECFLLHEEPYSFKMLYDLEKKNFKKE